MRPDTVWILVARSGKLALYWRPRKGHTQYGIWTESGMPGMQIFEGINCKARARQECAKRILLEG